MKVLALLLALCGTTLNALWPLIANAKPAGIPRDICSANVSERQTRGENSGDVPNRSHRLLHCALCSASAQSAPATAPRFAWLDAMPAATPSYLAADALIPPQATFYSLARSRAPPVFP
jgi:hypothetical protein